LFLGKPKRPLNVVLEYYKIYHIPCIIPWILNLLHRLILK
jgi:hypothetical protein